MQSDDRPRKDDALVEPLFEALRPEEPAEQAGAGSAPEERSSSLVVVLGVGAFFLLFLPALGLLIWRLLST